MIRKLGSCPKIELTMAWVSDCTGAPFDVATLITTIKKNTLNIKKNTNMLSAMMITDKGVIKNSQEDDRIISACAEQFSISICM